METPGVHEIPGAASGWLWDEGTSWLKASILLSRQDALKHLASMIWRNGPFSNLKVNDYDRRIK